MTLNDKIDKSLEKAAARVFYSVTADGDFGARQAIYELVEGVLVLRDEGQHDNLAGNSIAADFEGLSISQAQEKIEAENSVGSGHCYDGCHACTWSISMAPVDEPPPHLIYDPPPREAQVIRAALERYRSQS